MLVAVRRSHQRRCAPIEGKLVASPTRFISTRPSCAESPVMNYNPKRREGGFDHRCPKAIAPIPISQVVSRCNSGTSPLDLIERSHLNACWNTFSVSCASRVAS